MPAPLTLQCVCEGDLTAQTCQLDGLIFRVSCYYEGDYSIAGNVLLTYTYAGGTLTGEAGTDAAEFTAGVPLDVDWASLTLEISGTSSSSQPPAADKYALFVAVYSILETYICIDPVTGGVTRREVVSQPQQTTCDGCPGDSIFPNRVVATANTVTLYTSSPTGVCAASMVGVGAKCVRTAWDYPPDAMTINFQGNNFCLCPDGGDPPYHFYIVDGNLPCGQTLNPDTGCTEGTADGSCEGTSTVTFGVIDQAGDTATVKCNLLGDCNSLKPNMPNFFL